MSHSRLIFIHLSFTLNKKKKKVSTYSPFSIIKWNTLIWSKRTCRRGRSQREDCSRQLLSFYATVTFNAARSGGKTPLLCENWVERQTDKRRHEERAERGEKPRKTTHSREGRYYFSMNVSVSSTLRVIRKSLSNRLHPLRWGQTCFNFLKQRVLDFTAVGLRAFSAKDTFLVVSFIVNFSVFDK